MAWRYFMNIVKPNSQPESPAARNCNVFNMANCHTIKLITAQKYAFYVDAGKCHGMAGHRSSSIRCLTNLVILTSATVRHTHMQTVLYG